MASYLIKKDNKTNEIVYMEYELKGYDFTPSTKNDAYLKVNHVTLIKPAMIEKVLALKFEKIFKKLAYSIYQIIADDDSSESDAILALDEIARMKEILTKKYEKFLSKEKEMEFLKKLAYLEKEIKYKQILLQEYNMNYKEEKGMKM